jgi:ABC-type Fe3+-hydroxamate transport system substrate-binding protein
MFNAQARKGEEHLKFFSRRVAGNGEQLAGQKKEKRMKIKVYVAGVTKEVWFRGSRDERQVTVLNCLEWKPTLADMPR